VAHNPRHPLTREERLRLGADVAALRASGASWPAVAAQLRTSVRTAQRALADHREARSSAAPAMRPVDLDVEKLFVEVIDDYIAMRAELRELAPKADNTSAAAGVYRTRAAVNAGLLSALAMVGLLPNADDILLERVRGQRARAEVRRHGDELVEAA
jgi:hypothetical protein